MAKILIIDDDQQICKTLSEILREEGHDVKYVLTPDEGLKLISEEEFQVALVDLVMPHMSGIDVLSFIKRAKPEVQVIMITAFGTIENAVEAMKRGASDYISKPFKINEIQTSIHRVLEEAKFADMSKKVEIKLPAAASKEEVESILDSLANPIRRGVVEILGEYGSSSFTRIKGSLNIDDPTKLSFHLRKLKKSGIVIQDEEKIYSLSDRGRRALEVLRKLESPL
jgi:DNA-binding NtrC family response regulator